MKYLLSSMAVPGTCINVFCQKKIKDRVHHCKVCGRAYCYFCIKNIKFEILICPDCRNDGEVFIKEIEAVHRDRRFRESYKIFKSILAWKEAVYVKDPIRLTGRAILDMAELKSQNFTKSKELIMTGNRDRSKEMVSFKKLAGNYCVHVSYVAKFLGYSQPAGAVSYWLKKLRASIVKRDIHFRSFFFMVGEEVTVSGVYLRLLTIKEFFQTLSEDRIKASEDFLKLYHKHFQTLVGTDPDVKELLRFLNPPQIREVSAVPENRADENDSEEIGTLNFDEPDTLTGEVKETLKGSVDKGKDSEACCTENKEVPKCSCSKPEKSGSPKLVNFREVFETYDSFIFQLLKRVEVYREERLVILQGILEHYGAGDFGLSKIINKK